MIERVMAQFETFNSGMNKVLIYLILFFFLPGAATSAALEVRIAGDKLSLQADQAPLQEILKCFANQGISVRIDPQVNPLISVFFKDRDVQDGMESILKSLNHALIWESIPGPQGTISRLAEIQVFRPGQKDLMKLLGASSVLSIATDPNSGSLFVKNEILLKLNSGISQAEFQKLLKKIGGIVTGRNAVLGVYKIGLPENSDVPSLVDQITRHPGIATAEPNYAYPIFKPYQNPAPDVSIADRPQVSAPQGAAPIAILDTGLLPDMGLENFVLASLDALNPAQPLSDSQGHGTQMALIASGAIKPSGVKTETETNTPIIPIKAFDDNGYTSNFLLMESIAFALNHGARVMSLSWGSETESEFLKSALNDAGSKGLIVVASAGNEPSGKPVYPAAYPSVIGVGALGRDGKLWKQSNYGSFVTLYAPGFAALPVGYKGDPGSYAGTSIAAAFTANVIAAHLSKHPEATIQ